MGKSKDKIRKLAKKQGIEIIGKLRRASADELNDPSIKTWVDEAGNEFWKLKDPNGNFSWVIVTKEGAVI